MPRRAAKNRLRIAGAAFLALIAQYRPLPARTAVQRPSLRAVPIRGKSVDLVDWKVDESGVLHGSLSAAPRGARRERSMALAKLWFLEPGGATVELTAPDAGSFLRMRNGPDLTAKLVGGDEGGFKFSFGRLGEGRVPRTYVQGFRLKKAATSDGGFRKAIDRPPVEHDLIFVIKKVEKSETEKSETEKSDESGKSKKPEDKIRRFRGEVIGVENRELVVSLSGGRRTVALDRVYGVVFGELAGLDGETRDEGVNLHLGDGRTLSGTLVSATAKDGYRLRLFEGLELRVPPRWVREVEVLSENLCYLSSLKPRSRSFVAPLGRDWPVLRDKGLGGQPLRLGERVYRRGLLVVPGTVLHFELPRSYDLLLGEVGMPLSQVGSARLRFLVDGKPLGEELELTSGAPVREISLKTGRARRLSIEVTSTRDLDAGAIVVLGNLRLIVEV